MSLLLCRREPVKHPFYIEVLGIHIYSSQELCYVICNHPLLVMDGFVGKALYSFVKIMAGGAVTVVLLLGILWEPLPVRLLETR